MNRYKLAARAALAMATTDVAAMASAKNADEGESVGTKKAAITDGTGEGHCGGPIASTEHAAKNAMSAGTALAEHGDDDQAQKQAITADGAPDSCGT